MLESKKPIFVEALEPKIHSKKALAVEEGQRAPYYLKFARILCCLEVMHIRWSNLSTVVVQIGLLMMLLACLVIRALD
jgi:hypothetical protein